MLTYNSAESLYSSAKDKVKGAYLSPNTYLVKIKGGYAVDYFGRRILRIYKLKSFPKLIKYIVNTKEKCTSIKNRINTYSPVKIYVKENNWYYIDYLGTLKPLLSGTILYGRDG